jgi:hypothetical protein
MGRIKLRFVYGDAVIGSLDYRILFGVKAPAQLMPLSGRHVQNFSQTLTVRTVGNPHRCAVIAGGKNSFILDDQRSDISSLAC